MAEPKEYDDVQEFAAPTVDHGKSVRCVDKEAGVVIYSMQAAWETDAGKGQGITAVPLDQTDLDV